MCHGLTSFMEINGSAAAHILMVIIINFLKPAQPVFPSLLKMIPWFPRISRRYFMGLSLLKTSLIHFSAWTEKVKVDYLKIYLHWCASLLFDSYLLWTSSKGTKHSMDTSMFSLACTPTISPDLFKLD